MLVGQENLAATTLALWRRGGVDTLVKVLPYLARPDPDEPVGLCTALRFLLGRTSTEMSRLIGIPDIDLASGAEIFTVAPLPVPDDFTLTGYAAVPPLPPPPPPAEDEPPPPPAPPMPSHPIYPPSRGAPQWQVTGVPRARLHRIASLRRGERLRLELRLLPPIPAAG